MASAAFILKPQSLIPVLVLALAVPAAGEVAGPSLRLAVPRALPVVGREQVLVARLGGELDRAQEAVVGFHWRSPDGGGQIGADRRVELEPGAEETTFQQPWVPGETGRYELTARVRFAPGGQDHDALEATQSVTAVKRDLHLHYYHPHPSLEYVTGTLARKHNLAYWMDRGVIAQDWAAGKWGYSNGHLRTPEAFAEHWVAAYRLGKPGVAIDEFPAGAGGTRKVDTILCEGLVMARKLEPGAYLAVYTTGVNADYKIRAFREAADLVLVEAYEVHAGRGYGNIRRCESLESKGLADKALACLGLGPALPGKSCITTPRELRRQFHFVRYNYPHMPGVAFFGSFEPLYPALNEAIRRFYIGPVLHVGVPESGTVRVENIGADDSPAVYVRMRAKASSRAITTRVPPLGTGEHRLIPAPGQDVLPLTDYTGECLVLGPPLLWDREPAEYRPGATARWPAVGPVVGKVTDSFDTGPQLELTCNTSGEAAYDGNIAAARYDIPPTDGRACRLEFDLATGRVGLYAGIRLEMADRNGTSRLGLGFSRSTGDPGAYVDVSVVNSHGVSVGEVMAHAMKPDAMYRVRAEYHPGGVVRAAILDPAGGTLWDTGGIPTYGGMTFDRIEFGVQSGKGAAIAWDAERKALLLRGVAGAPRFAISAYVDNLEVTSFETVQQDEQVLPMTAMESVNDSARR